MVIDRDKRMIENARHPFSIVFDIVHKYAGRRVNGRADFYLKCGMTVLDAHQMFMEIEDAVGIKIPVERSKHLRCFCHIIDYFILERRIGG